VSTVAKIVLLAGTVKARDTVGHHDYLAGCRLAAFLLEQTPGVTATVVREDWPRDESVLAGARALVFYNGGGEKHPFLDSAHRLGRVQDAIDDGAGIVMIHRAVRFPHAFASQAATWIGGVHVAGESGRGHWPTHHGEFPGHPVTRGVPPWTIFDGWLNGIRFVDGMRGVTPLVWSGKTHRGSSAGGGADIVGWTYDRPDGGRAFCFTGLDAHAAWSVPGVRQLVVNGILWSAGVAVSQHGAPCAIDDARARGYLTPRLPKSTGGLEHLWRRLRRLTG
jgi:hypothetical protein